MKRRYRIVDENESEMLVVGDSPESAVEEAALYFYEESGGEGFSDPHYSETVEVYDNDNSEFLGKYSVGVSFDPTYWARKI